MVPAMEGVLKEVKNMTMTVDAMTHESVPLFVRVSVRGLTAPTSAVSRCSQETGVEDDMRDA